MKQYLMRIFAALSCLAVSFAGNAVLDVGFTIGYVLGIFMCGWVQFCVWADLEYCRKGER